MAKTKKTEVEMFLDFVQNNFIKMLGCYILLFALLIGTVFYSLNEAYKIYKAEIENVEKVESK